MTPWVTRLLVANIAVFLAGELLRLPLHQYFAFIPHPLSVVYRPWTFVTYMFLHGGLGHIFFNMLTLFFFGPRVEERMGSRRFVTLYFLAGLTGAILSIVFRSRGYIIGASGATFGVMMAFAHYWPRQQIMIWGIIPVEARILVLVTTALAIFGGFTGGGGIAHFAHLGGYLGAWLYLRWIETRTGARSFQQRAAPKVDDKPLANWKKVDVTKAHEANRDELNRILDKISASGLSSLTPQERAFLSHFVPPDDRTPPVS